MLFRRLSLSLAFIPTITVITCLFILMYNDPKWICNPFTDGCFSISAVGRNMPAVYIFKPVMMLVLILYAAYFINVYGIFKKFLISKYYLNTILMLTLVTVIFLAIYIAVLGVQGSDVWRFMRRIGIYFYITSLVLNLFVVSLVFNKIKEDYQVIISTKAVTIFFYFNILLIIAGLIGFLVNFIIFENTIRNLRHLIEWNYFSLIQISFFISFFIFKNLDTQD